MHVTWRTALAAAACLAALYSHAQIESTTATLPASIEHSTLDVHDGFEGSELGPLWIRVKMVPGSAVLQSKIVRAGHQALAITVRPHDVFGRKIVDLHRRTAYLASARNGYPAVKHVYFKMGLYRNLMQQPMTAFFDEYSKRAMKADEF